ncbi:hypothetical protein KGF57_003488 [Candida theae]|uniref:FAS1 domain-containing protein n=1 Tax=Candida theae TaxID=1198502 RepID=A0AAD5FXY3_9ASCO|nr:uncharacterized protein KGF57_003488 [Candida theae]KAI5956002.1 hypothetical protein KGF57_003488 [Candida theae]
MLSNLRSGMQNFSLFCLLVSIHLASSYARPTTTSDEIEPTPSYIVDILSAEPQFSYFLRTLQRNGIIPQLNLMQNVTLLAPVNSAFVGSMSNAPWEDEGLLRYIINQDVSIGNLTGEGEVIYDTLYNKTNNKPYPIKIGYENDEYVVDDSATIVEADIYAGRQKSYIQAIDKLLPVKSTMCEALLNSDDDRISIVRQLFLSLFPDEYDTFKKKKKKKKKKHNQLPKSCSEFLANVKTVVLPSNDVISNSLDTLQLKYYLANTASPEFDTTEEAEYEINSDIFQLLRHLMFEEYIDGVNGTDKKVTSLAGLKYTFHNDHGNTTIVHFSTNQSIALADGILQVFETGDGFLKSLKIPTAAMIARKALFAHHYSKVVKELKFRSLESYIDGLFANQTILVDVDSRDDVSDEEIKSMSFSSKQELMYRFIDDVLDFNDTLHILANTRLCSKKKLGGCYKMKVSKKESEHGVPQYFIDGGVEVGEAISILNSSQIFITKDEVSAPLNLKHSLGDLMSNGALPPSGGLDIDRSGCVRTLKYFNDFNVLSLKDNEEGYTIFLPCGMADSKKEEGIWNELGLVLDYLEANPNVFKTIIRGMILQKTIYSDFEGSSIFKDIDDDPVHVKSLSSSNEFNRLEVAKYNVFDLPLNSDVLFNQGVIHVVNKVILPREFYIPINELIATTFDASLPDFSISRLLDVFPDIKKSLTQKNPYSLLIPQADSLKEFNITKSFANLHKFLQFHLIPNNETHKLVDCAMGQNVNEIIRTNLTRGGLVCKSKKGQPMLQLYKLNDTEIVSDYSYNKNQEVKLISHGCTRQEDTSNRSCVFLIDKPLNLQWFKRSDNFLHIHLGIVSLGLGIILGLIIFGGVMIGLVLFMSKRGNPHRKSSHADDGLPRADAGFMSVLTDDDDYMPYDRGYETDVEVMRSETDRLFPKKKRKIRHYGSAGDHNKENEPPVALPRDIGNVKSNLTRDRNLPGVSQF